MTDHGRLFDPDQPPVARPAPARPAAPVKRPVPSEPLELPVLELPVPQELPVLRVLPDVSGLDREFDYVWGGPGPPPEVGSLVRVELARRLVAGWVTAVGVTPPAGLELQPVRAVLSVGPSPELVELARWTAHRWSGRFGAVLRAASPPRRIRNLPEAPGPVLAAAGATVTVVRHSPNDDLAERVAALPGSVLVVTPRLDQAGHLIGRLRQAGVTARLHPRDWAAAAGRGGVVVGARSAVWARVADLGAVVVLDEHDDALQEERNPTWHARDVAAERARRAGIPCLLASPCPSLAALALADRVEPPARSAERAGWPVVELIDRRGEEPGRAGLFSPRVAALVRQPGTVLAMLNRKGRAVMLSCAMCGELARTEDGERLMVEQDGRLVCPATGETRPLVCANCGATALKRLRLGVARAAEELAALAGEPVAEIAAEAAAARLRRTPTRITVGTEAALHHLGQVDTVVFLDFDQELLAPRFRAAEQAMALLVLAARLTGPRTRGGRIIVQTRTPEHRVLRAAVRADPGLLAEQERAIRQPLGLPPFGAQAEVSGPAAPALAAVAAAAGLMVLGPRPDGRYLVRAPDPDTLADALAPEHRPPGRVRVAIDPPRA